jgi:hypothetical protein
MFSHLVTAAITRAQRSHGHCCRTHTQWALFRLQVYKLLGPNVKMKHTEAVADLNRRLFDGGGVAAVGKRALELLLSVCHERAHPVVELDAYIAASGEKCADGLISYAMWFAEDLVCQLSREHTRCVSLDAASSITYEFHRLTGSLNEILIVMGRRHPPMLFPPADALASLLRVKGVYYGLSVGGDVACRSFLAALHEATSRALRAVLHPPHVRFPSPLFSIALKLETIRISNSVHCSLDTESLRIGARDAQVNLNLSHVTQVQTLPTELRMPDGALAHTVYFIGGWLAVALMNKAGGHGHGISPHIHDSEQQAFALSFVTANQLSADAAVKAKLPCSRVTCREKRDGRAYFPSEALYRVVGRVEQIVQFFLTSPDTAANNTMVRDAVNAALSDPLTLHLAKEAAQFGAESRDRWSAETQAAYNKSANDLDALAQLLANLFGPFIKLRATQYFKQVMGLLLRNDFNTISFRAQLKVSGKLQGGACPPPPPPVRVRRRWSTARLQPNPPLTQHDPSHFNVRVRSVALDIHELEWTGS